MAEHAVSVVSSPLAVARCARLQTGYARNYAVWIFLGAALIVLYFMIFPNCASARERIERR